MKDSALFRLVINLFLGIKLFLQLFDSFILLFNYSMKLFYGTDRRRNEATTLEIVQSCVVLKDKRLLSC